MLNSTDLLLMASTNQKHYRDLSTVEPQFREAIYAFYRGVVND